VKAVNVANRESGSDFDVAFVDIGLPDISGVEVGRQIQAKERPETPRLIALSGFGQERDVEETEKAGFELHLVKPVDLAVIEDVLNDEQTGSGNK
jgi:two-component system CheB/CheR fusion protein